jgi:dihydrofolate reductase
MTRVVRFTASIKVNKLQALTRLSIILVFGSHVLWNDLLAAGLVDELHLMVTPVVVGEGTPLFTSSPTSLRLVGTRIWENSGNVLLQYQVSQGT